MKTTRKIIPALVMLLVSAIMLSTASYAWFAQSSDVEAKGMQVKVKSEARFLLIKGEDESDFSSIGTAKNTLGADAEGLELVHADLKGTGTAVKSIEWWTDISTSTTSPNEGQTEESKKKIDDAEINTSNSRYVLYNTFKVKLAEGSTGALYNFSVSNVTVSDSPEGVTDNLRKAIRILVVGDNGVQLWSVTTGTPTSVASESNTALINEVTTLESEIKVYIYFDGEDSAATTANVPDSIPTYDITISFEASQTSQS